MSRSKNHKTYFCRPCGEFYHCPTRYDIPRPCPSCGRALWPHGCDRTDDPDLVHRRQMHAARPDRFPNPDPEQLPLLDQHAQSAAAPPHRPA